MKAVVAIRLKDDVPDPAGRATTDRLIEMGFTEVKEARVGKILEIELEAADRDNASERIKQMCERLLANAAIEEFSIVSLK